MHKTAVSGAMSGSRAENLLQFLLLWEYTKRRPGLDRRTIENILPQERYHLIPEKRLQCLLCATQMHTRR